MQHLASRILLVDGFLEVSDGYVPLPDTGDGDYGDEDGEGEGAPLVDASEDVGLRRDRGKALKKLTSWSILLRDSACPPPAPQTASPSSPLLLRQLQQPLLPNLPDP